MAARKKPRKVAKQKSGKNSSKLHLFLVISILLAAVFLPTAFLLVIGLAPMATAFFVDRTKKKTKVITVGAMNLAGCMPFLLELWMTDHSLEKAFSIMLDPMTVIVIYCAAGVGYTIDWALTLLIASVLYQRGMARKKAIEKRQGALIERWGEEVAGQIPMDHEGFPVEKPA